MDLIDDVLDDISVGPDAMRWAPDPVADLRLLIHREWPARRQATWRWWCATCRQPLPQPHWRADGVPDGGVILPSGLRAFHQTIDAREPRHPVVERVSAGRPVSAPPAGTAGRIP